MASGGDRLRLLLIGATGSGKSCTGNTIFLASDEVKKKMFLDGSKSSGMTTKNEEYTRTILGREVTIVDTPGVANITDGPKKVLKEIRGSIMNSDVPYDALLLVIDIFKNGLVMEKETLEVIDGISKNISKNFWDYTVLVFTYEDKYWEHQRVVRNEDQEEISVSDHVNKSKTSTEEGAIGPTITKVGIKAVASIDNTEKDKEKIKEKVAELFKAVDYVRRKNKNKKFGKDYLNWECAVM